MASELFLKLKVTAFRKILPIWGMLWIVIFNKLSIPCQTDQPIYPDFSLKSILRVV